MYSFMSLREFLGSFNRTGCIQTKEAHHWLEHYEAAKVSFEKYGPEGPPYGLVVETLRAGFGGYGGERRTLAEFTENPTKYFCLKAKPTWNYDREGTYLSERINWWKDFKVVEQ